jgi:hypothetical protein
VESIDSIYIRALLNRVTGQYSTSIRAMLVHLFTTYGKITPQQVSAKQQAAYAMQHYDITLPVDTVFNTIEDLADLADHATSPMSAQQQIDMAYVILSREPILQQDIRLWNRRPLPDRTWPNMLVHFLEAQADLSSLPVAADVYHQQTPHQANSVSVIADVVAQCLLDAMPAEPHFEAPLAPVAPVPPAPEQANVIQRAADGPAREAALHTQMQEMIEMMRASHNNNNNNHRQRTPSNYRGRGRANDRNTDRGRGRGTRAGPRKYCWTHGSCAHSGADCNTTVVGHQPAATFANMMGGSTDGCYWVAP